MQRVSALIADDEQNLRDYLKLLLTEVWPELHIVAEASNGNDALALLREYEPDIAFLDIKMPGLSGLSVAQHFEANCHIVFITAYNEFAVQAFELEAIDYLLKPLDKNRLAKTAQRLQASLGQQDATQRDWPALLKTLNQSLAREYSYIKWLKALEDGKVYIIPVEDVRYIQSGDKYTTVVTPNKSWLIRKPVKDLENELDPDIFWRIHRGTIVNASYIVHAARTIDGRYQLRMLDCDEAVTASRAYAHRFKQM